MGLRLGPGEKIIFEGHPSWRSILGFYLKGFLIAIIISAICNYLLGLGKATSILVFAVIMGITVVAGLIYRIAIRYTITSRRLNIKRGIIARNVQEAKIERVQDVTYNQSVYQRVMQIGDVNFDTAAHEDGSDFVFAGVADPAEVVDQVHRAGELFESETGRPSGGV